MPAIIDIKSGAPQRWIRYQLAGYKILWKENVMNMTLMEDTGLHFDELHHKYKIKGILVPGVTQVLKSVGLCGNFDFVSEEALWLGTQTHKMVELFNTKKLDESTLDPLLVPRLDAYKKFVSDYNFSFSFGEVLLGSKQYGFAGRPDIVGSILDEFKFTHIRRFSVHLKDDGRYTAIEYKEPSDETVFLHAVAVTQEKIRIGLEK